MKLLVRDDSRRKEEFQDVYKRQVQIVTFGTLAARGVIRDVGRVLDLSLIHI